MLGNVLWCRNAGICSRCAHSVMLQDGLRALEVVRFIICCYNGTFYLPDPILSSFSFFRPYSQAFLAKILSWVSCSCLSNLHVLHLTDQLLHRYDLTFATVNSENDWAIQRADVIGSALCRHQQPQGDWGKTREQGGSGKRLVLFSSPLGRSSLPLASAGW